jgi:hypothetical protein
MGKRALFWFSLRLNRRQALRSALTAGFGALAAAAVGRLDVFALPCTGGYCGSALCAGSACSGTNICSSVADFSIHESTNCWSWSGFLCCDCEVNCGGATSFCFCYA